MAEDEDRLKMLCEEDGEIFFNGLLRADGEGDLVLKVGEGDCFPSSLLGGEGDLRLLSRLVFLKILRSTGLGDLLKAPVCTGEAGSSFLSVCWLL